jgi:serine/threonine-protein kinase
MTPERICSNCGETYPADAIFCPRDGLPLFSGKLGAKPDVYLGLDILGQIKLQRLIGIGAMGRVYRAHQSGVERSVAVKILHRELLANGSVIARFHREAKLMSRLDHPNIVQVLLSGSLEPTAPDIGGEAYLVTEFLDGISLASALAAAGGPLALPRAVHVLAQVADAVGEAHAQGIVHRDLKPENVMLVQRGQDPDFAKVLDFGVARVQSPNPTVATEAGVLFGTARYMSPEGAQGNPVVPQSDVYSLAVMLFQCLAGRTPFEADSAIKLLVQHASLPAPDLRSMPGAENVPAAIAEIVARNLAKDPGARARDGREFAGALIRAARACGVGPAPERTTLKLASVQQPVAGTRVEVAAPSGPGEHEPADEIGPLPMRRSPITPLLWLSLALFSVAALSYALGAFGPVAGSP